MFSQSQFQRIGRLVLFVGLTIISRSAEADFPEPKWFRDLAMSDRARAIERQLGIDDSSSEPELPPAPPPLRKHPPIWI